MHADLPSLVGWLFGGFVVVLFGWNKFHEEHPSISQFHRDRVIAQIYLRDLSYRRAFSQALVIYIVILLFCFVSITLVGDTLVDRKSGTIPVGPAWPIFAGLLIAGLAPNLPWFGKIEEWLRGMMHSRAMTLRSVTQLKQQLIAAPPTPDALDRKWAQSLFPNDQVKDEYVKARKSLDDKDESGLPKGDSELSEESLAWLDTAFLIKAYETRLASKEYHDVMGRAFFDEYRAIWQRISKDFEEIEAKIEDRTRGKATVEAINQATRKNEQAISGVFEDAHGFIGLAIASRDRNDHTLKAFEVLGLKLVESQRKRIFEEAEAEAEGAALFMAFVWATLGVFLLVVCLSASELLMEGHWFFGPSWPRADSFYSNMFSVMIDYTWYGIGLLTFYVYRKERIDNGQWIIGGRVPAAHYLNGAIAVFMVSVVVLFVQDVVVPLANQVSCTTGVPPDACSKEIRSRLGMFPERNWLRMLSVTTAPLLIFSLFESVNSHRQSSDRGNRRLKDAPSVSFFRVLFVWLAIVALDFLAKVNLEIVYRRETKFDIFGKWRCSSELADWSDVALAIFGCTASAGVTLLDMIMTSIRRPALVELDASYIIFGGLTALAFWTILIERASRRVRTPVMIWRKSA